MTNRKSTTGGAQGHLFGGGWTTKKLEVLRRYLNAYVQALKKQKFGTFYIDAFAGTGYRTLKQSESGGSLFFPDLAEEAPQQLLEGSAKIALQVEPRFDRYIFVEKDPHRCDELKKLQG